MDRALNALAAKLEFEKKYYNRRFNISAESRVSNAGMDEYSVLINDINNCRACTLINTVTKKVPGGGSTDADLMLIGEAPGYNEDKMGKPFVGKAGEKLTGMLGYIGMSRDDVYITNVVKCRPPNNADPEGEWIKSCSPFLDREISIIKPRFILTLGRFATKYMLGREVKMKDIAGKSFRVRDNIILVPTYHPSALLHAKGQFKDILRHRIADDLNVLKNIMEETDG